MNILIERFCIPQSKFTQNSQVAVVLATVVVATPSAMVEAIISGVVTAAVVVETICCAVVVTMPLVDDAGVVT